MDLRTRGRVGSERGVLRALISILLGFVLFGSLAWLGCLLWFTAGAEQPIVYADFGADPQQHTSSSASGEIDPAADRDADPRDPARAEALSGVEVDAKAEVRLTGRVVDDRRRPVEGATVGFGSGVSGSFEPLTTSAADGSFSISLASWPEALRIALSARTDGRAGTLDIPLYTARAEIDAGTIVLGPAASVRVLVSRQGAPVADAFVALELESWRSVVASARTNAAGVAEIDHVPCDGYRVVASTPTEEGRGRVLLPDESEVQIELRPLRTYEVKVLDIDSGRGIEGAEVTLGETLWVPVRASRMLLYDGGYVTDWKSPARVTTDANGTAILSGVAARTRSMITVRADGYRFGSTQGRPRPIHLRDDSVVEVKLKAERSATVRWLVEDGEVPPPATGTVVRMQLEPGFADSAKRMDGRMEGPWLVLEGVSERGGFLASTDDRRIARAWISAEALEAAGVGEVVEGEAISFRRMRSITVQITNPDGTPAAGAVAIARDQGNGDLLDPVTAGPDGIALLDGLHGRLAEVCIGEPGSTYPQTHVGSVDLEQGSAALHAVMPRSARVRIAMTCDGEARLPAAYRVHVRGGCRVVSEDPDRGEVLVEIPGAKDPAFPFSVVAGGFLPASGTLDLSSDAEARAEVALRSGGWFQVAVSRDASTSVELGLEVQGTETGLFGAAFGLSELDQANGPGDSFRFGPLAAGVYRAVDRKSGLVSDATRVVGDAIAAVQLVIPAPQWVSGQVEVPVGTSYREVRVVVEGEGLGGSGDLRSGAPPGMYVAVRDDGSFRIRIPGDRAVTVKPWHAWLQPTEDGVVVTSVTREGVVLRLDAGQEVQIQAPALVGSTLRDLRVGYWSGQALGAPDKWIPARMDGDRIRFGAPAAGGCSLMVDPGTEFAPVILNEVVLGEGVTDLGPVAFTAGSTLEVRIQTAPDSDPPRIAVWATRTDEPSYRRMLNSNGEGAVELRGLGAGHFRIRLSTTMNHLSGYEDREIDLDGASDVEVVYDVR